MRTRALLLLATLLAAGCLGSGDDGADRTPGATTGGTPLQAPWWNMGESWTIEFQRAGHPPRTTTLVNFANDTWDPAHFWLGTANRDEAMQHVFFETNPFLGRIHHVILSPHEKGMHSAMYEWPLDAGARWTTPLLFGREDIALEATERRADGTVAIEGEARKDGAEFAYDYDPALKWFRHLEIRESDGTLALRATVKDHKDAGAKGTFHFLRGRDYLDSAGGRTGQEERFTVKDEGATTIAFLVNVQAGPGSRLEFIDPTGQVFHSQNLLAGGTANQIFEAKKAPPPGEWKLRTVGSVTGEIKVRGVIEYKTTL
jgi:hypothetical protein